MKSGYNSKLLVIVRLQFLIELSWWDLIRSKQLSSVHVCRAWVFAGFSGHGNSIHNILPLLKKENVDLYSCPWGHNNYADAYF